MRKQKKNTQKKLNIQKSKIMASGPTTSWQTNGEKMEIVTDFTFLGSEITVDGDCNHEIETLAPWKKSYDQPRQHIKKQRHYFANKCLYSRSYGFPVVMYVRESFPRQVDKESRGPQGERGLEFSRRKKG